MDQVTTFVEQTYQFAGVSRFEDELTYRFGNDVKARTGILKRCGHTDIQFWTLPRPMVLKDAVEFLKANGVHAELPKGQRKGPNGGPRAKKDEVQDTPAVQLDAHVQDYERAAAEKARKAAEFVEKMRLAREAKKARAAAEAAEAVPA